jgi:type III restriction enzyme
MIGITLKDFQPRAVDFLYDNTIINTGQNNKIIMESPTGSGKTIILISYIEKYFDYVGNTIFVWLTPGKGELEEQSREKMKRFTPSLKTGNIQDILQSGFSAKATYFINWEVITKSGNIAISDTEKANLFNRIKDAHRMNLDFIVIIDEEHLNDTSKAQDIINAISAKYEIRVSATTVKRALGTFYRIEEIDVINEELITKAMYINKDIDEDNIENLENETDYLIEKANSIRKEIKTAYEREGDNINPLVLIQFPNLNDDLIERVEKKLEQLGYTYNNNLVASWFAEETKTDKEMNSKKLGKINIGTNEENSITINDAAPYFLLFKQALATGWDCPRAKILVKLRERMTETFEIQTLGRLRRMPLAKHYGDDLLDCSYIYTFDEKYKLAAINVGAYETEKLHLKEDAKNIELVKEIRNKDVSYVDERSFRNNFYEYIVNKYKLENKPTKNQAIFENNGFAFGNQINASFITGRFVVIKELEHTETLDTKKMAYDVDTHAHGIELRHVIDNLKKYTALDYSKTRMLLETFFRKKVGNKKYKILNLDLKEFYAFIINNQNLLRDLLIAFDGHMVVQILALNQHYKTGIFKIPLTEYYRFSRKAKNIKNLQSNVYIGYNTAMITDEFRSTSERLLEKYCENNPNVKSIYKNGDNGLNYLSIVYRTGKGTVRNFYPDYIVRLIDDTIWIIETKGGESKGQSKNIDIQVENKFKEFKRYSETYNYNFAFVRDINDELYFNNTVYSDNMHTDEWKEISLIF